MPLEEPAVLEKHREFERLGSFPAELLRDYITSQMARSTLFSTLYLNQPAKFFVLFQQDPIESSEVRARVPTLVWTIS